MIISVYRLGLGRIPAHGRGDGSVAGIGQSDELVAKGLRRVRESVEEQHYWP